ncbi:hypothetical protein WDU94_000546 [Cyamophila willieti]
MDKHTSQAIIAGIKGIKDEIASEANERRKLLNDSKEVKVFLDKILEKVNGIREKVDKNSRRIDNWEKEKRMKNVIFFGIPEKEDETMRDLENTVMKIMRMMKIEMKWEEIDFIKRLGREKIVGKTRGVLVTLTTLRKKMQIMRNTRELRNTNIYVREHFTKEVSDRRKELWTEAKKLRLEGKYAVVKFDKLIVKESFDQIKQDEVKENQSKSSGTPKGQKTNVPLQPIYVPPYRKKRKKVSREQRTNQESSYNNNNQEQIEKYLTKSNQEAVSKDTRIRQQSNVDQEYNLGK